MRVVKVNLRSDEDSCDPEVESMEGKGKKPCKKVSSVNKSKVLGSKSKQIKSVHARKSMSTGEVKSPAMIRAKEVQTSLGTEYPSFVRLLITSHVSTGYWMKLPVPFCKSYLPIKATPLILVTESGEQFQVKLIADKTGLSAGWKKFVVAHNLLAGDVLIFQLVDACKFKVHIVRADDLTEVNAAPSPLNLEANTKDNAERVNITPENKKRKTSSDNELVAPPVHFKDVKSFEDFNVSVNGVCIDSKLPQHIRRTLYDLYCSKNAFLHDRLLQGLNGGLVEGIILETANIATAIRACKLTTTSRDEFAIWDTTLKSFELLGMNVGFLRDRVRQIQSLAFESEGASVIRRYMKAKTDRAQAEVGIEKLEAKLVELKEECVKFDADIQNMKSEAERYELMFQKEVDAPW